MEDNRPSLIARGDHMLRQNGEMQLYIIDVS